MKHASVHALRQDWHYSDNMAADLWQDEVMKTGLLLLAWLAGVPFADAAQAKEDALVVSFGIRIWPGRSR